MTINRVYSAHAERHGDIVAIRLTGGSACLWLNMYLDLKEWQMTCDSDIGSYAYRFGKPRDADERNFIDYFCNVEVNEGWLLRKCVDEMHLPKGFNAAKSEYELCRMAADAGADEERRSELAELLDGMRAYSNNKDGWIAAICVGAEERGIDLPEGWGECITEKYTPQQRRFARICSEVIVPELRRMMREDTK